MDPSLETRSTGPQDSATVDDERGLTSVTCHIHSPSALMKRLVFPYKYIWGIVSHRKQGLAYPMAFLSDLMKSLCGLILFNGQPVFVTVTGKD